MFDLSGFKTKFRHYPVPPPEIATDPPPAESPKITIQSNPNGRHPPADLLLSFPPPIRGIQLLSWVDTCTIQTSSIIFRRRKEYQVKCIVLGPTFFDPASEGAQPYSLAFNIAEMYGAGRYFRKSDMSEVGRPANFHWPDPDTYDTGALF